MMAVAEHYDRCAHTYIQTYGTVIQSARPLSLDKLLDHEFESAKIENGQTILDAGCGVCGPAIYFARNKNMHIQIYGLTISRIQYRLGQVLVKEAGVQDRVTIQCGDYNALALIYPHDVFDRVLFLESLCHATNKLHVLKQTYDLLRPQVGCIYIKDYFRIDFRDDAEKHRIQQVFYDRMDVDYHVRFVYVTEIVEMLRALGFEIEFVRSLPIELRTDTETALEFEALAGLHWRSGLPFETSESMEILARKT